MDRVLLRNGKDEALLIQRDLGVDKVDLIEQKETGYGLTLKSNNGFNWRVFQNGAWKDQLVMGTNSWLGIGGNPASPLHVMDSIILRR